MKEGIDMRKATTITGIILIVVYVVFLAVGWKSFPDELPTHFNASGIADTYGPKSSLLLEPAIMLGLFVLLAVVECFPKLWNISPDVFEENEESVIRTCHNMFGVLKIAIILVCAFSGLMCIYSEFPVWPMYVMIAVILITVFLSVAVIYRYKMD